MWLRRIAWFSALSLAPALAMAQQPAAYPQGLQARAIALLQRCQAAGGQPANSDKAFVYNIDLTGDGRTEFVMDEAGFICTARQVTSATPDGAPLEVFDGASGRSLWRGMAYAYTIEQGPRNVLNVTLRGAACGAGASAQTTCRRPLSWNASTGTLTGAPTLAAPSAVAQAPADPSRDPLASGPAPKTGAAAAPVAAPEAPKAGTFTLTEAEKVAVFRAAGFKQGARGWERCEDPGTPAYEPGGIAEVLDLNNDGRREVVLIEGGNFCFGFVGTGFVVMSEQADGSWRNVMEINGVFRALPTRHNGWQEIEVGGPGTRGFPIWRYNGREYEYHRGPRPGF